MLWVWSGLELRRVQLNTRTTEEKHNWAYSPLDLVGKWNKCNLFCGSKHRKIIDVPSSYFPMRMNDFSCPSHKRWSMFLGSFFSYCGFIFLRWLRVTNLVSYCGFRRFQTNIAVLDQSTCPTRWNQLFCGQSSFLRKSGYFCAKSAQNRPFPGPKQAPKTAYFGHFSEARGPVGKFVKKGQKKGLICLLIKGWLTKWDFVGLTANGRMS